MNDWLQQASEWIRNNIFVIEIPLYSIFTALLTFLGVKAKNLANAKTITDNVLNKLLARFEVLNEKLKSVEDGSNEQINEIKTEMNDLVSAYNEILTDIKNNIAKSDVKSAIESKINEISEKIKDNAEATKTDIENQITENK